MPFHWLFVRSPLPDDRQTTITVSIHTQTRLSLRRPGPPARPITQRRLEPAGSRRMVGGVNEAAVVEMFQVYRRQFRDDLNIIGDDTYQVNCRCAYTREHKLAAIDYALNT